MGGASSKKKKGKGFLGDLADAAEGASSSITKAIEDTSNQVTSGIENTTKSVTGAIDNTAKRLSGTAQDASAGLSSAAGATAGKISSITEDVKGKVSDAKSKAEEAEKSATATLDAAKKKAESAAAEAQSAAADVQKRAENAAAEAKKKAESAAADVQKRAEDAAAEAQKKTESAVAEAQKKAENAAAEAKRNAEDARKELEDIATGLQGTATDLKNSAEESASNLKTSAETAATNLKNSAESKASEMKSSAENKANELKGAADSALKSAENTASQVKASGQSMVSSAQEMKDEMASKAAKEKEAATGGLSDLAENTTNLLQNTAETLKSTVTGAVGSAVSLASSTAIKTVEGVSGTVSKATSDISKSLTGAVTSVTGSATNAAGSAAAGLIGKAGALTGALAQGAQDVSKAAENLKFGSQDTVTATVCKVDELKDGEMKVFSLNDEGSILLTKENGKFSAIGTKCSHYGAPLVKGVLYNGKVRCPWHGACFNASTGDIEDSPGLDSLPCYQVDIEDGEVKVTAPKDQLKHNLRSKELCGRSDKDSRTFVVVGGGGAGEACAESLRQEGFQGRLVLISKESDLPYDRPKLSKALTSSGKDIALRQQEFFNDSSIEMLLEHEVASVNTEIKNVECSNGVTINYDALLLATGGIPLTLDVPGKELDNICYLRTPADANRIAELARDKNAVIVGTSFIGMEVAAYLHGKAKTVTVVGRSNVPFSNVFGEQIGERLKQLYVEKDVKFQFGTEVSEFKGDGKLSSVVLKNGETLDADLCIIGIGVKPCTNFLGSSGLDMNKNGYVVVDQNLKASADGVYAAGDIAEFPLAVMSGQKVNIGHWQIAQTQGRLVALNMLGKERPLHTVPFFWASMFGKSLRYAGYGHGADDFIIDGDLDGLKFVAYCCKGDTVVAVATSGCDPVASQYASFLAGGKVLKKVDIQTNPKGWLAEMS